MKTTKQKKDAAPRLLTNGLHDEPAHDEIARCAYSLWEQQGRPQDEEIGIWLQAEAKLRQSQSQPGVRA